VFLAATAQDAVARLGAIDPVDPSGWPATVAESAPAVDPSGWPATAAGSAPSVAAVAEPSLAAVAEPSLAVDIYPVAVVALTLVRAGKNRELPRNSPKESFEAIRNSPHPARSTGNRAMLN